MPDSWNSKNEKEFHSTTSKSLNRGVDPQIILIRTQSLTIKPHIYR